MISVIIPTLNEEEYILETINQVLHGAVNPVEIIVIDSGSIDNTVSMIRSIDDIKLKFRPDFKGRKQAALNHGAQHSSGAVLVFLDADTHLPARFDQLILKAISAGNVGGAFPMKFDKAGPLLRSIQLINHIRYSLTNRFFGDQAVFCTREAFFKAEGYPDIPIMESAHFCDRLKKDGRLKLLYRPVISSSRRFYQGGVLNVFWKDVVIYSRDLLGISNSRNGEKYWSVNASPHS